ncbi:MAG: gamma carbonic anhydrase family protein [Leadbetterella sp.]
MLLLPVLGISPSYGDGCWIAPNATLVGDLVMGNDCTVWFNAVIRADVNKIRIGHTVNIQDGVVIHCTYKKTETRIGDRVSIGHNAILHGCTVEDEVLIGMGAIIMDGVKIGKNVIIGAGAVVTQNTEIPSGTIWVGNPARYLKNVDEKSGEVFLRTANNYTLYADWFRDPSEK